VLGELLAAAASAAYSAMTPAPTLETDLRYGGTWKKGQKVQDSSDVRFGCLWRVLKAQNWRCVTNNIQVRAFALLLLCAAQCPVPVLHTPP
jgi:hypothetical protein